MTETKNRADFHVHYTPETSRQIIQSAKEKGIKQVALVGRINIPSELGEIIKNGEKEGVSIVPGLETYTKIGDTRVDLISLGFDLEEGPLHDMFEESQKKQANKYLARHQKEFLESVGFTFNHLQPENMKLLRDLLAGEVSEKAIKFCQIAASLEENQEKISDAQTSHKGEWEEVLARYSDLPGYETREKLEAKFLYNIYFSFDKPGYIPVQNSAKEIIDATHESNGVILYSPEGSFSKQAWNGLLEDGIDGIMGWHGGSFELDRDTVRQTRERGLLILGGSDFDPEKRHWQIGNGSGSMFISPRRIEELRTYRQNSEKQN